MNIKIVGFVLISVFFCFSAQKLNAQNVKKSTSVNVESNKQTPNFYGEKLDFRATLVDLPGANLPESSWQVYYEIYFVGETEFDKAIQSVSKTEKLENGSTRSTANPTAQDFPGKILLTNGNFTKKSLSKIADRIVERKDIEFGKKIIDKLKTERAKLLVSYTVKIYDANLKKNIYRTGLFIQPPFVVENDEKQARRDLFLSFYVTEKGELYPSSLARDKTDTTW